MHTTQAHVGSTAFGTEGLEAYDTAVRAWLANPGLACAYDRAYRHTAGCA